MYLWQIEYNSQRKPFNSKFVVNRFKLCIFDRLNTTSQRLKCAHSPLWIALNYVSLTDWIQQYFLLWFAFKVVNRFKLCIFDRLNTTKKIYLLAKSMLWIALNYVSLTDWIQRIPLEEDMVRVVNRFKLCIFDRLNTTDILE